MNPSDTDAITQQYFFLTTLAKGLTSGQHLLVSKKVAGQPLPNGKPRDTFATGAWREEYLDGPWYFNACGSNHHKLRRQANAVAVLAVILDDVGTKVPRDKVLAAPTWELETSPGNFQLGFMLKEPSPDVHAADELYAGLVAFGIQDPGVRDANRLFRVPGSVNNKPGKDNFRAVLHDFNEARVYTLQSLAKALKVQPIKLSKSWVDTGERPAAGQDDPLFDWMLDQGMVLCKATRGWWEIECPFSEEHTDGRETCKYLPLPDSNCGRPQVRCHHSHGDDEAAFAQRFYDWVKAEGGPVPDVPGAARSVSPEFQDWLRTRQFVQEATVPKTLPAQVRQQPPEPTTQYDQITLADALGNIPKGKLARPAKTADGGYKERQRATHGNVLAGMRHLKVQSRLNLMNGQTSYVLPEHIDMAPFGAMTVKERDSLIESTLLDIFDDAGMQATDTVADVMDRLANSNYWHPAEDWVKSRPWDGVDRFEALLDSLTTSTPDLARVYLRRWLLQCIEAACGWHVRRDTQKSLCLVLAGPQGCGKTSWLMSLAPGYSCEGKHLNLNGYNARDSKHEALQGWIVELGELDSTFKKSDQSLMKAFLSNTVDEYRLPHAKDWLTRPRTSSFCASVNDENFLQDVSGNRRFGALGVTRCDAYHGIDMQQLWAQVKTWWDAGEQWWLRDDEVSKQNENNERFRAVDGIEDKIASELGRRDDHDVYTHECSLSQSDVCSLLGLRIEDKGTLARVGHALRHHQGDCRNLRKRGGGPKAWVWWLTRTEAEGMGFKQLRPALPSQA